jgi:hypothetical protein
MNISPVGFDRIDGNAELSRYLAGIKPVFFQGRHTGFRWTQGAEYLLYLFIFLLIRASVFNDGS